ncbi:MAG: FAD:protein FMN transferase [Lachnospiraceae bacterium]|nr:FAD:protein FMN transferase [Lachnospiraceae bacterium]
MRSLFLRSAVLAGLISVLLLCSCSTGKENEASGTGVYFDTVIDIKIYDERAEELLSDCFKLCGDMERILSAHDENSELYRLNHRKGQSVEVSGDLASCIKAGLYCGEISDGAFDITILPVSGLWDFGSETHRVPGDDEIKEALKKVGYGRVHCEGNIVTFDDPETQIDLGGIAKGYISSKLKEYLKSEGCTSAMINLGGNVSTVGSRPDGSAWVVGIQEPFKERGTVYETVEVKDRCVVSSGTYERHFAVDGKEYHHILDPSTGYPADTSLEQATVVGEDDVLCDALSTICVLLGKEKAGEMIKEQGIDVDVLFIDTGHNGYWEKAESDR